MGFALSMMKLLFPGAKPVWPALKSADELDVDVSYLEGEEDATEGTDEDETTSQPEDHGSAAENPIATIKNNRGSDSYKDGMLKRPDRLFCLVNSACAGLWPCIRIEALAHPLIT